MRGLKKPRMTISTNALPASISDTERKGDDDLHRLFLEISGTGTWDWDDDSRILRCSHGYFSMLGLDPAAFDLGDSPNLDAVWTSRLHPDDRDSALATFRRHLRNPSSDVYENHFRMRHADGHWVWIRSRGKNLKKADGSPSAKTIGTHIDVSSRKKAADIADVRRRLLERIASRAPLPDILTHIARAIESLCPGALCSILLLDREGRHLLHGAAPGLPESYNRAVHGIPIGIGIGSCGTAAATGGRVIAEDIDTHPYWADYKHIALDAGLRACWSEPILSDEGKVIGTFGIYHAAPGRPDPEALEVIRFASDITARAILRKRAETEYLELSSSLETRVAERTAALESSLREAESAGRAKRLFIASMSHELRTPMNAVLGYTRLMLRDPATPEAHRTKLDTVNRAGEHLLSLLNDTLAIARLDAGRERRNDSEFDPRRLLADLVELHRPAASGKGLSVQLDLHDSVPELVLCDEAKLRRAITNLLGNAVKFTVQGSVTLRAQTVVPGDPNAARLIVEIADTGPGIPADVLPGLFRPFAQLASDRPPGTGLGLSLASRCAELLDGELSVSSAPGVGSTFTLSASVGLVAPAKPQTIPAAPERRRVLIVDDQETNRELLRAMLEPMQLELMDAAHGGQAVKFATEWQPDVILMDMRMPIMDGHEATRRIRETCTGRPPAIISVSAADFEEDIAAALAAGADEVLPKPFRAGELHAAVLRRIQSPATANRPESAAENALDPVWRHRIREASLAADYERLLELCTELETTRPASAADLLRLTRAYDYDAIRRLVAS